jgi:hypothetical protein
MALKPYETPWPSLTLKEILSLGFIRADSTNRRLLLPNGVPVGVAKQIVNNNADAAVSIGEGIGYLGFTGTQVGTLTINFPAAAADIDGLVITVYTQAAVGTALTLASSGATFNNAPATLTAGQAFRYIYDHATLKWYPA